MIILGIVLGIIFSYLIGFFMLYKPIKLETDKTLAMNTSTMQNNAKLITECENLMKRNKELQDIAQEAIDLNDKSIHEITEMRDTFEDSIVTSTDVLDECKSLRDKLRAYVEWQDDVSKILELNDTIINKNTEYDREIAILNNKIDRVVDGMERFIDHLDNDGR